MAWQMSGRGWVRATIDGEADVDPMCRMCGKHLETVMHLASGCGELTKNQYVINVTLILGQDS